MPSAIGDVPFCDLLTLWPQVEPLVARALERDEAGRYQPRDILRLLLDCRVKLWVSWNEESQSVEAMTITETIDYPRLRELRIWLVGGRNMRAWVIKTRDAIEEFARATGCHVMTGGLRKGWLRIGGEGWVETGITFEKRLT